MAVVTMVDTGPDTTQDRECILVMGMAPTAMAVAMATETDATTMATEIPGSMLSPIAISTDHLGTVAIAIMAIAGSTTCL